MLLRRLKSYRDIYRYHRQRSRVFAEHDYRQVYLATRARLEEALGRPVEGLRMLDVGCGQRFPASLLFAAAGNRVTGIDTDLVVRRPGIGAFMRVWRANGFERAAKTLARQLLFDPTYHGRLAELCEVPLSGHGLDLRRLSITERLPFPDAHFDAIISNAVFEHVPDVPAALREVGRVLKTEGVLHIAIHLFPSLSGGHNMRWAFPDSDPPEDVPPWDHLRERRCPAHVYLNEFTAADYRDAVTSVPEIRVDSWVTTQREGEGLLTPAIENTLSERYSREDLLKREVVLIGHKL